MVSMSKIWGKNRDRMARIAGRQAHIMATQISIKDHIVGRVSFPVYLSDHRGN